MGHLTIPTRTQRIAREMFFSTFENMRKHQKARLVVKLTHLIDFYSNWICFSNFEPKQLNKTYPQNMRNYRVLSQQKLRIQFLAPQSRCDILNKKQREGLGHLILRHRHRHVKHRCVPSCGGNMGSRMVEHLYGPPLY